MFIVSEAREVFFFAECVWWKFLAVLTQTEPIRPSGFCEPYISAIMRVLIWNKIQKMRTFLNCESSNFQIDRPNLASKLTFVSVISPKLSELETWNKNYNYRNVVF